MKIPRTYYQPNCKSDVIDLSSQTEENEGEGDKKDDFFPVKLMDNSNNKYIYKYIKNFSRCSNLLETFIEDNLGDKHILMDFRVLSKH